jgi:TonB family protein
MAAFGLLTASMIVGSVLDAEDHIHHGRPQMLSDVALVASLTGALVFVLLQKPAGPSNGLGMVAAVEAFAAVLLIAPSVWLRRGPQEPRTVMTISLGGGSGPQAAGGMTSIGARPVQVQTPPEETQKREPVRPPAAVTPEMTLPTKNARTAKATPAPPVKQAPEEARGKTPTKGAQRAFGSSMADTAVRGQGFGLSTGGGAGSGSTLDVADFCCPDYLFAMVERIRSVWAQNQGARGECIVKFTIQRDGTISTYEVEKPSGNVSLDLASQRAVAMTRKLPALPDAFPNPTLTVHLNFKYQ